MLDEILSLLHSSPGVRRTQVGELITYGGSAFRVKIRAELRSGLMLQVWLNHNDDHTRYAYQLLQGDQPILRWDNAPHHPELIVNYPHHVHDRSGGLATSPLSGNPVKDVAVVLAAIAEQMG